jgi:small subunit ribosomal protein S6
MKKYEILCVLPGTLAEDEVAPIAAQIESQLKAHGAEDIKRVDLGKSRLAYPMKHIRYGYFEFFTIEILPEKVLALEQSIRLIGGILRVGIQVHDPKQKGTITLALDPTALSAPPKADVPTRSGRPEVRREHKERPEVVLEEKKESVIAESSLNLENIGEKLDEILQKDIDKV